MLDTRPPGLNPNRLSGPGYSAPAYNRQSLAGLSVPGIQSAASPGTNPFGTLPGGVLPSSYSTPSSTPAPNVNQGQPHSPLISGTANSPNMNSWNGSRNMSTLLRTLVGNTTTPGAR